MQNQKKYYEGMEDRIQQAVKLAGGAQKAGAVTGFAASTIYNYMRLAPPPPYEFLVKLAEAASVRAEWLLLGQMPRQDGDESGDWESALPPINRDQVRIPIYDIAVSAGAGSSVLREEPTSWAAFPTQYVREIGEASSLHMITVEGDSMEPDLRSGDTVMFDVSATQPRDGMFVIRLGDQLLVKRLRVLGGGTIELVSSNPLYRDIQVDLASEDFEIKGRVKWKGNAV
jgi:phage repressor protein C with HTH and peptisase S24 domain